MRRRSSFRNVVEYGLALGAVKSLEWVPLPLADALSRGYVRLLDLAIPRLRKVALRNLELALPELDPARRAEIAAGVFRSIARALVAFAKMPSIRRENLARWVRWEGEEHWREAVRRGRGVLFATAHLGNWELSAHAHALLTGPMDVVVRPLDNPFIDGFVARRRALAGNRPIVKRDSARSILKALAAGRAVGILIDQNVMPEAGVFVDFFGLPACSATGFAKIAARSGAPVVPGFALWSESERKYVLRFYPAVEMTGDAAADTQRVQSVLEQRIRAYPDQWLWIHRRWKTRPAGQPSLYETAPGAPRWV